MLIFRPKVEDIHASLSQRGFRGFGSWLDPPSIIVGRVEAAEKKNLSKIVGERPPGDRISEKGGFISSAAAEPVTSRVEPAA